jgi:gamma-glutamyltranspeptidase/glutathione hydrolase
MSRYSRSIVASGHSLVSATAADVLREGGNAFDAVVAAGFASAVVEPSLNSLGGGGLLIGHSARFGQELFFDFFVDTPGLGRADVSAVGDFFPVTVQFSGSTQDFNIGCGSVAVPGTLKGLIHTQRRLGRMNLAEVIAPAKELARCHLINEQQGVFLGLLYPIMTLHEQGRALYEPGGVYKKGGELLENPLGAEFLEEIAADGGANFYAGDIAAAIDRDMGEAGGLLSSTDLASYRVIERSPLKISYRGHELLTAPEPSVGGALIGLSIGLLEKAGPYRGGWGDGKHLCRTVALMQEVEKIRESGITSGKQLERFWADGDHDRSVQQLRIFSRGTTHISIADKEGNCASMTCSNGEGSGYFAPGTGIMLNNMMGEDDLHPGGFHSSPPGQRVGSMMSPSLLIKDGAVSLVIGSGGSKRIRTAISQVLNQIVDFNRNLKEAVEAPRLHWDGSVVQVEPGFEKTALDILRRSVELNCWECRDVYFGGVHAVIPGEGGAGDPRRGGSVEVVE